MKPLTAMMAFALVCTPAFGYIDPGSGALVWQALAAAAIGILVQLNRLKSYFRKS